ncbi:transcriptional repressor TraM [Pararhizobium sp.]|uniref:transcriptional repressor TraM n=1 Tax=Pararhizobium sp. TaxID=1977563 RepID=UPI003D134169
MEHVSLRQNTSNEVTPRYSSMQKSELEVLAIAAIHEHRNLLAADAAVYEEWTCANDDPTITSSVLRSLQDEYLARQERSEAQQRKLSEIIDALGYVPEVPVG